MWNTATRICYRMKQCQCQVYYKYWIFLITPIHLVNLKQTSNKATWGWVSPWHIIARYLALYINFSELDIWLFAKQYRAKWLYSVIVFGLSIPCTLSDINTALCWNTNACRGWGNGGQWGRGRERMFSG